MMTAEFVSHFPDAKKLGNGWQARCPAHDDQKASLSISEGEDGRTLLWCHAGCDTDNVLAEMGLPKSALFTEPLKPQSNGHHRQKGSGKKIAATYDYRDESGALLCQVVRYEPKDFRQRKLDGQGGWIWKLGDTRRVLYRLPELKAAAADATVFIVEGEKDADRLRSLDLVATSSMGGAGKWRAEFVQQLRAEGTMSARNIVILPDNDEPGQKHAENVAQSIVKNGGGFSSVKIISLPDLPEKGDVSDWLDAGGTKDELLRLVAEAPRWQPKKKEKEKTENDVAADAESETKIPYRAEESGLKWIKGSSDSSSTVVPLCNFTASITADVIEDDGTESRRHYEITAKLAGETEICTGTTPATDFASLKWVDEILGARATILPGKAEHTRAAIRLLSTDIRKQRIIAHTGWREFDGRWLYFHHGGAIGADGLTEAAVRLPAPLAPFDLPDVPQGEARATAFKAVIELLSAAPDEITVPLIGAAFVAVLGKGDFSLHLCGQSGIGKSELAALVQSFFGAGFNGRNLPASWVSTGNSLEGLAHAAKDALLTVDDFCPQGTATDISRLHATAERVLRAQGNHSGRGRMNADGSLKPARPPRGLILSTGEDIPRNQSLRARLLILEIEKESDPAKVMERLRRLTPYQETARAGVYAQAMAAFIQWLATDGRIGAHQKNADAEVNRWRLQWHERGLESHGRTPTTLAHLARAWHLWIQAADEAGAVTAAEAEAVWRRVWQALTIAGKAQAHHLTAENPVTRFIELVQSVLTSGRAHLASLAGNMPHPDIAVSCGWQNGEAKGERIGWIDGDDIYLEPGAAFSCVQRAAASGEALTVAEKTLWKRLKEAGKLSSLDSERRPLVKKMICGNRPRVLHFKVDIFPAVSCHEKTGAIGAIGATGD